MYSISNISRSCCAVTTSTEQSKNDSESAILEEVIFALEEVLHENLNLNIFRIREEIQIRDLTKNFDEWRVCETHRLFRIRKKKELSILI